MELMKGSLNTFLNAFTYPDRTCYPVASCNLQVRVAPSLTPHRNCHHCFRLRPLHPHHLLCT